MCLSRIEWVVIPNQNKGQVHMLLQMDEIVDHKQPPGRILASVGGEKNTKLEEAPLKATATPEARVSSTLLNVDSSLHYCDIETHDDTITLNT
uniref:Uncharacterized protein n=1 Tax=Timema poppense TaxID=170557 RepID=A0A7R9D4M0_TIMPO|nr:unnamed protein product [Timema poppensis]